MADELNQEKNLPETQPGDQNPPEMEGLGAQEEIAELESMIAQQKEELANAKTHLIELEQAVADRDSEIATLEQTRDDLEERLATTGNSLAEAVASYKAAVVQTNPEVIEELISGDTIEAISESLEKAKTLVSKVRQGVEAEISLARVPAGAPERTPPDFSALSPREKIQYAIRTT